MGRRRVRLAELGVAPDGLRPLVPAPLELDLRDGRAWLCITTFRIGGLRSRATPQLNLGDRVQLVIFAYEIGLVR